MILEQENPDPCKFCGGGNIAIWSYANPFFEKDDDLWRLKCLNCSLFIEGYVSRKAILAAWNRKPDREPITQKALQEAGFIEIAADVWQAMGEEKSVRVVFYDNKLREIWKIAIQNEKTGEALKEFYGANAQTVTLAELLTLKRLAVD